jgi:hypothetical protein
VRRIFTSNARDSEIFQSANDAYRLRGQICDGLSRLANRNRASASARRVPKYVSGRPEPRRGGGDDLYNTPIDAVYASLRAAISTRLLCSM